MKNVVAAVLMAGLMLSGCVSNSLFVDSSGLVAYYPMDGDGDEAVRDRSDNANDLEVKGATFSSGGARGQCWHFSGDGDFLEARHSPSMLAPAEADALTISLWIKPDELNKKHPGGFPVILEKGGNDIGSGFEMVLRAHYGSVRAGFTSYTTVGVAPVPIDEIPINEWTHVAAVYDGLKVSIYINGEIAHMETRLGLKLSNPSRPLRIGKANPGAHRNRRDFSGWIDEVRLYSRALTVKEIVTLSR